MGRFFFGTWRRVVATLALIGLLVAPWLPLEDQEILIECYATGIFLVIVVALFELTAPAKKKKGKGA